MNPYLPIRTKIKKIMDETSDTKTFVLEEKIGKHLPGQFVELTVFGVGEAPISISSADGLELTVRKVGDVSGALFKLKKGDFVGIRGPFGNTFPLETAKGKNLVLVAGGIGLAPIRSVIQEALKRRKNYENIHLYYGARTSADMSFSEELNAWKKQMEVFLTIDQPEARWTCDVGFVHEIIKNKHTHENSVAMLCGPPIMMRCASDILKSVGVQEKDIFVSLERLMKCGIGKCGHCMAGGKYVCMDGPIFSLKDFENLSEKLL